MDQLRQAAQQALTTIEATLGTLTAANEQGQLTDTIWFSRHETLFDYLASEAESLRAALAQPSEQEPVVVKIPASVEEAEAMQKIGYEYLRQYAPGRLAEPAEQPTRTGSTAGSDEECTHRACATNCPALKEPAEQEPVSGVVLRDGLPTLLQNRHIRPSDLRLYTTPQPAKREALTDEEITAHFQEHINTGSLLSFAAGVRFAEAAYEAKNGITKEGA